MARVQPEDRIEMVSHVTVLGGGAMGTACSVLLSEHAGTRVTLWMRDPGIAADVRARRENVRLLPGVPLPAALEITADAERACAAADLVVVAIPTAHLRSGLAPLTRYIPPHAPVVSVIKGLEIGTFLRPSQILTEVLGARPVVALCGPSHAEEIARRLPASVVVAGTDAALARSVQQLFTTDRFRVYTNSDLLGVELAGALKNVIAIAAGISDGLDYGDNAKAALLTRGVVELSRFGAAMGAEAETFSGLAGLGDLVTTCFSRHSRNRLVGERLGRGESLAQILATLRGVAEGVTTCRSVAELAESRGLEMPITHQVYRVLFEGKPATAAADSLMLRPTRGES